jgi:hypothetical protein
MVDLFFRRLFSRIEEREEEMSRGGRSIKNFSSALTNSGEKYFFSSASPCLVELSNHIFLKCTLLHFSSSPLRRSRRCAHFFRMNGHFSFAFMLARLFLCAFAFLLIYYDFTKNLSMILIYIFLYFTPCARLFAIITGPSSNLKLT